MRSRKDKYSTLTYLGKVEGDKIFQLAYANENAKVTLPVDDLTHDITHVGIEYVPVSGEVIVVSADCATYDHRKPHMEPILLPSRLRYEYTGTKGSTRIELTDMNVVL